MISKPSPKMIAISLIIALGILALPIDDRTVTQHTSLRLGRNVLSSLFPEAKNEAVVLEFTGSPVAEKELRSLIQRRNYATIVEGGAPVLAIHKYLIGLPLMLHKH